MQEPNFTFAGNAKVWATNDLFSPADSSSTSHHVSQAAVDSPAPLGNLPLSHNPLHFNFSFMLNAMVELILQLLISWSP
jgi:hypothetical protein